MQEELITIVMSAYNAEQTICRAINSIIKQTYTNWELIVVDDCSTDKTCYVVNKYKTDDNRIKLVQKDVNAGAGMARRTGITYRSEDSKYLCFIDSDDEIFEDYLIKLYTVAKQYNAEVVNCGFVSIDKDKQHIDVANGTHIFDGGMNNFFVDEGKIYTRFMNCGIIASHLWNKVIYNGRRFVEDTPTFIEILYYAKRRVIIPYVGYIYYQNDKSLCHTSSDIKRLIYTILCGIDTYNFFLSQNVDVVGITQKIFADINKLKSLNLTEEIRIEFEHEFSMIAYWIINKINFKINK